MLCKPIQERLLGAKQMSWPWVSMLFIQLKLIFQMNTQTNVKFRSLFNKSGPFEAVHHSIVSIHVSVTVWHPSIRMSGETLDVFWDYLCCLFDSYRCLPVPGNTHCSLIDVNTQMHKNISIFLFRLNSFIFCHLVLLFLRFTKESLHCCILINRMEFPWQLRITIVDI